MIQLIRRARHDIHNAQIGDLAGAVCRRREGLFILVRSAGPLSSSAAFRVKGFAASLVEIIALRCPSRAGKLASATWIVSITAVGQHGSVILRPILDRQSAGKGRLQYLPPTLTVGLPAAAVTVTVHSAFTLPHVAVMTVAAPRRYRSHNTVRDRSDRLIPRSSRSMVSVVFSGCAAAGQNGSFARQSDSAWSCRASRRSPGTTAASLFKADCHIVIGEVGGLREAIAVIAGAGHIERDLAGPYPRPDRSHFVQSIMMFFRTVAEVDDWPLPVFCALAAL